MGLSSIRADVVITEFMADNERTITNRLGMTSDWIEIHNGTVAATNLVGWRLTDDLGALTKWTFPSTNVAAGAYLLVYASDEDGVRAGELHTNFKLSKGGEDLALVRPDLTIAYAYTNYPEQGTDVSYGIGSSGEHRYFPSPTPGAANTAGATGVVADTKFTPDRGFYFAPLTVTVTSETAGATIHYTTDSGDPTTNGAPYGGPIPITNTTVLRAAAFKPLSVPTDADSQTYIFPALAALQPGMPDGFPMNWTDRHGNVTPADYGMDTGIVASATHGPGMAQAMSALPFVSLVTARSNLFGAVSGIYANPLDSGIAWERAGSVEYVETGNANDFGLNCGLRVDGTTKERSFADTRKKSFAIAFRGQYGAGRLDHDLFDPPTAVESFDDLVLRGGTYDAWGRDSLHARAQYLRNAFAAETQRAMGGVAPHSRPVHLYLDGLYWGLYEVSERPTGDLAADYFGGSGGNWDVFLRDWEEGDGDAYAALLAMVHAGPVTDAVYQRIQGNDPGGVRNPAYPVYFDPQSYIDYVLLQMWIGNHRWIENNLCMMRNRDHAQSSGFKWCVWDSEAAMAEDGIGGLNLDMTARGDPTGLRAALLANEEFRLRFADRLQRHMSPGGALTPEAATARYRALADRIEPAIAAESARWGDQDGNAAHTLEEWQAERDWILNTYLPRRGAIVLQQFRNAGMFPGVDAPTWSQEGGSFTNGFALAISSPYSVYYTLDGSDPRQYRTGAAVGTIYTAPIPLTHAVNVKARARGGPSNEWSALKQALFTPAEPSPLRVTELMYHPRNPAGGETNAATMDDAFQFIELLNTGADAIGLAGVRFTDGVLFDFDAGRVRTLAPGERVLVVSDLGAFTNRYAGSAGMTIAGEFGSAHDFAATRLASGGERIRIEDGLGRCMASFTYGVGRGWPLAADGAGHSLVPLVVTNQASGALDYAGNWRASAYRDGSPGRPDADPVRDVVLNEIMAHTDHSGGEPWQDSNDWIELYNATPHTVGLTNWYLSDRADDLRRWAIPASNTIAAMGWRTFFEVGGFHPSTNSGFGLSKDGDSVYLSYLPGTTNDRVADCIRFYGQENEFSLGRYADGSNAWVACRLTPDAANQLPSAPMVVFSELMYHPRPTLTHAGDNTNDEFVELHNPSAATVTLMNVGSDAGAWRIAGGIDFAFPSNTVMAAGGYLALVSFDPVADTAARDAFLSHYGLTNGQVRILGPYAGQLSNAGEAIRLERPVYPDAPGDPVSWFVVDQVSYLDQSPWPAEADGTGMSLRRTAGTADGNDPANWGASPAGTPGWFTTAFRRIVSAAGGGGSVLPSADMWVPLGVNATLDMVPDPWYSVSAVSVDGTNAGTPAQVTFTNVVTDHAVSASFAADVTTNGVPHWWLATHGWTGDFDRVAVSDVDHDGMATWEEYHADTVPTDGDSVLAITGLCWTVGGMEVFWKGGTQAWQSLEFRERLAATDEVWSVLRSYEPPTATASIYAHEGTTNRSGVYRLKAWRSAE